MAKGTDQIFDPFHELSVSEADGYLEHYGRSVGISEIREAVYGGFPLSALYSTIAIQSSTAQTANRRATITLLPQTGAHDPLTKQPLTGERQRPPLVLGNVQMNQFLVSGLPQEGFDGWSHVTSRWDGRDHWDDLDAQYRVELCHSEVSRWSIEFKTKGVVHSGADIEGGDDLEHIELINNCTTATGFEFKIVYGGRRYHGSFGRSGRWFAIYRALCERQAGAVAWQGYPSKRPGGAEPYLDPDPAVLIPPFLWLYDWTKKNRWGTADDPLKSAPHIDLGRYRTLSGDTTHTSVAIEHGTIIYDRWGKGEEYYQKPKERRLLHSWRAQDGTESREPPRTYKEVRDAQWISFPDFTPEGLYAHHRAFRVTKLGWLYDLNKAVVSYSTNDRFEITMRRAGNPDAYELRRLVIGNLLKEELEVAPAWTTLDRFGYAARPTTRPYDASWEPHTTRDTPSPYSFLLGGRGTEESRYLLPEPFGVERILLAWSDASRRRLVIDLISYERILPVWRGTLDVQAAMGVV